MLPLVQLDSEERITVDWLQSAFQAGLRLERTNSESDTVRSRAGRPRAEALK